MKKIPKDCYFELAQFCMDYHSCALALFLPEMNRNAPMREAAEKIRQARELIKQEVRG